MVHLEFERLGCQISGHILARSFLFRLLLLVIRNCWRVAEIGKAHSTANCGKERVVVYPVTQVKVVQAEDVPCGDCL